MGEIGDLGFVKYMEKFSYYVFLNLVYNESLYQLLYAWKNFIFMKIPVPEIWPKMLLANQIAEFLNQIYL